MRCIGHIRIINDHDRGYDQVNAKVETVCDICSKFSSLIEPRGEEVFLDLSGHKDLWRELWQQLADLERKPILGLSTSKLVAKIASGEGMTKKGQIYQVKPGEERDFLKCRPLEELWLADSKSLHILKGLGLTHIGQLANLSDSILREYFGSDGYLLKAWGKGIDFSPVKGLYPPASVKTRRSFEEQQEQGTNSYLYLKEALKQMADEIFQALTDKVYGEISLKLKSEGQVYQATRSINYPVTQKKQIERGLFRLLDSLVFTGPVQELEAEVKRIRSPRIIQGDLFTPLLPMSMELSETIDYIKEKYGVRALREGSSLLGCSRREQFLMLLEKSWQG